MATVATRIVRPLSAIVVDLATTRQRIACCEANPRDGDAWDDLNARRLSLEVEFEAGVFAETGVNWDMLQAVRS